MEDHVSTASETYNCATQRHHTYYANTAAFSMLYMYASAGKYTALHFKTLIALTHRTAPASLCLLALDLVSHDTIFGYHARHRHLSHGRQSLPFRMPKQPLLNGRLLICVTITCYHRLMHDSMSDRTSEGLCLILGQVLDEVPWGQLLRSPGGQCCTACWLLLLLLLKAKFLNLLLHSFNFAQHMGVPSRHVVLRNLHLLLLLLGSLHVKTPSHPVVACCRTLMLLLLLVMLLLLLPLGLMHLRLALLLLPTSFCSLVQGGMLLMLCMRDSTKASCWHTAT